MATWRRFGVAALAGVLVVVLMGVGVWSLLRTDENDGVPHARASVIGYAVSSTGKILVAGTMADGGSQLVILEGAQRTVIRTSPDFYFEDPAWSPDGMRVAYVKTDYAGDRGATSALVLHDLAGESGREVVASERFLYGPRFSSNGESIFFVEGAYSTSRVYGVYGQQLFRASLATGAVEAIGAPVYTASGLTVRPTTSGDKLIMFAQRERAEPGGLFEIEPQTGAFRVLLWEEALADWGTDWGLREPCLASSADLVTFVYAARPGPRYAAGSFSLGPSATLAAISDVPGELQMPCLYDGDLYYLTGKYADAGPRRLMKHTSAGEQVVYGLV